MAILRLSRMANFSPKGYWHFALLSFHLTLLLLTPTRMKLSQSRHGISERNNHCIYTEKEHAHSNQRLVLRKTLCSLLKARFLQWLSVQPCCLFLYLKYRLFPLRIAPKDNLRWCLLECTTKDKQEEGIKLKRLCQVLSWKVSFTEAFQPSFFLFCFRSSSFFSLYVRLSSFMSCSREFLAGLAGYKNTF